MVYADFPGPAYRGEVHEWRMGVSSVWFMLDMVTQLVTSLYCYTVIACAHLKDHHGLKPEGLSVSS